MSWEVDDEFIHCHFLWRWSSLYKFVQGRRKEVYAMGIPSVFPSNSFGLYSGKFFFMIAIQLFGITESKNLVAWRKLVSEALEQLEIDFNIQVVSDLEQFIRYDLIGIPALVIGEEVLFQRELPDLEELVAVLREKIESTTPNQHVA